MIELTHTCIVYRVANSLFTGEGAAVHRLVANVTLQYNATFNER